MDGDIETILFSMEERLAHVEIGFRTVIRKKNDLYVALLNLRHAQQAYMANRGDHRFGQKVAEEAARADEVLKDNEFVTLPEYIP